MPLPWKKTKIDRVSRFVADLRSSNRGESLVVQTGFPTSLIDLFVKNRGRLKKPSSKKKHKYPLEIAPDLKLPPRISTPELNSLDSFRFQVSSPPVMEKNTEREIGKDICTLAVDKIVEEDIVKVSVPNRAFMLVLKLFLVLILALATKKLTIGITVSAFMLLFLEFVGTRLFCFFNPCLDARRSLNSVFKSVLGSVQLEMSPLDNKFSVSDESGSLTNEIQIIEPDLNNLINGERRFELDELGKKKRELRNDESDESGSLTNEIQIIEPDLNNLINGERRFELDELGQKRELKNDEDVIEDENFKNPKRTNSKIKAKLLKKFVLKTFRGGSKRRRNDEEPLQDLGSILPDCTGEEKELIRVEEEQNEIEVNNFSDVSQFSVDTGVGDNVRRTKNGRLGHIIPFVIILAGLIGGRVIALVLTITWCLLKKIRANFGEKLQGDPN